MSRAQLESASTASQLAIEELIDRHPEIPTIPELLVRIWKVVDDPESSAADLEEVVLRDPPLAARVLRLANSPYYGCKRGMADLRAAITVLGFDVVRNLAICLSVAGEMRRVESAKHFDRVALWRHSVATAIAAREFGLELGGCEAETLFAAGLLHDIGSFVLALCEPSEFDRMRAHADAEGLAMRCVERELLGFDHAELGRAFARRWCFPDTIQEIIGGHHGTDGGGPPLRAAQIVHLGDAASERMGPFGDPVGGASEAELGELLQGLDLDFEWLENQLTKLHGLVGDAGELMRLM